MGSRKHPYTIDVYAAAGGVSSVESRQRASPSAALRLPGPLAGHGIRRVGLTAVEVLVSTLLASLLMVAMLGVLGGLKAQQAALQTRTPQRSWQRLLDAVLQRDLENSRSYELTGNALILRGFAGRDLQTGNPSWKPTTVLYQILSDKNRSWLTRRELTTVGTSALAGRTELVLAAVEAIRTSQWAQRDEAGGGLPPAARQQGETPIVDGLIIEFWGTDRGGPLYGYRFRRS